MGCGSDGGVVLLSSQSCQLLEGMREGSELARRLSRVGSERVEHIRTSNFMLEVSLLSFYWQLHQSAIKLLWTYTPAGSIMLY
jgi:hypothetical protein